VSLSVQNHLESGAPRFPAVLDTGNNHNFALQHDHLERWAGLSLSVMSQVGEVYLGRQTIPRFAGSVWLHPNQPGQRDVFASRPPVRLRLPEGMVVYPRGVPTVARLPILGLRALVRNKLHFGVDPERCVVKVRSPDWRTWLLRLLS